MNRAAAPFALALTFFACALLAGCAAPGDPTARHPVVPVAVADLAARQYGSAFALTFTLPSRSVDHEALSERPAVEIYRATLLPGAAPDQKTTWRLAYTIPSEQLDGYLKGEKVEFHDPLTADDFARAAGSANAYKIRTRAARTRDSADSNVVLARIYPAPEAPQNVRVNVTESALLVSWDQAGLPPGASSRAYRVYRGVNESGAANSGQEGSPAKLKTPLVLAGPSATTEFRDTDFQFGTTYVYTVRTVAQFGEAFVESADSAPVILTPRDVFPPAEPMNLEITILPAAGQASASIELSWDISPEADLAGYFVYRSDAEDSPGERVTAEILPSPTFRDISVLSGKRYFYRVSAVDRAGNESQKSSATQADVP